MLVVLKLPSYPIHLALMPHRFISRQLAIPANLFMDLFHENLSLTNDSMRRRS